MLSQQVGTNGGLPGAAGGDDWAQRLLPLVGRPGALPGDLVVTASAGDESPTYLSCG